MKRTKKFLMFVPVLGLFLSGCSFKEVKHSIGESWVGQHILHPVYDPIRDLINGGKKEEQKSGGDVTPSGDPTPTPAPTPAPKVNPLWPADEIATALKDGDFNDSLPGYTGEAEEIDFSGTRVIITLSEKTADAENAAIAVYASDLLRGGYKEGEVDDYGDMHYTSPNDEIDVCAWGGSTAATPSPGFVIIDLTAVGSDEGVTSTTFPLEYVNSYLSQYSEEYGFTFSQSVADSISALASEFYAYVTTDSLGFPECVVGMAGSVKDQVEAAILSTITSAGFEYDSEDDTYYNSYYYSIYVVVQDGATFLVID